MSVKRVFLIVLDSFGIGHGSDAAEFGDEGSNTLAAIRKSPAFSVPNLQSLGLFSIDGVERQDCEKSYVPIGAFGRLTELSQGKDTTIGHWEIAGVVSRKPLPVYPEGFPEEIVKEFTERTGRGILLNKPCSGTEAIRLFGEEHCRTGKLIVYTSADSVFQVAAHEEVVPIQELYEDCRIARKILMGDHGVGRVIARPFIGEPGHFERTRRHDFSLEPPGRTMLDVLKDAHLEVRGVGKIYDIFAGKSIDRTITMENNEDGMRKTLQWQQEDFEGLCFVNLVDFDIVYGHRNDIDGYARAASDFDRQLGTFLENMREDDVVIITADHGCDPGYPGTDHTREQVPVLFFGGAVRPGVNLGTRRGFCCIASTVLEMFGLKERLTGESLWQEIKKDGKRPDEDEAETESLELVSQRERQVFDGENLINAAFEARKKAYTLYSHFSVGAALLTKSGKVYQGCNIENAAYGPSVCAERTAIFKAVSEGERDFLAIAVVGGRESASPKECGICAPCGVCRQVMMEFCDQDSFQILVGNTEQYEVHTLKELLPFGFGRENLKQ